MSTRPEIGSPDELAWLRGYEEARNHFLAENERLNRELVEVIVEHPCYKLSKELEAENARLREALGEIAINYVIEGDCNSCDFGPSMSSEHSEECTYRIARAALEGK